MQQPIQQDSKNYCPAKIMKMIPDKKRMNMTVNNPTTLLEAFLNSFQINTPQSAATSVAP